MTTHSSILAWKILWTEEPGGLYSSWGRTELDATEQLHFLALESDGKMSAYNAGGLGSIPGLGRSPTAGNGNPLQYSCLENSVDGGAWWATVHGVAKESDTTEPAHTYINIYIHSF